MLLIYPPLAKACEPPTGIAILANALQENGHTCTTLDANLEGQLFILNENAPRPDTWSMRAHRNLESNIRSLQDLGLYGEPDRYRRAVIDLNKVLEGINTKYLSLSLSDYRDQNLSPVRSDDLLRSAADFSRNIFSRYFEKRLETLVTDHSPSHVGFSINYLSQALTAFSMIGFLKERYPNLKIIAGGGLITSWLANPEWRNPFKGLIDQLVAGPGENFLLDLMAKHKDNDRGTAKTPCEEEVLNSSCQQFQKDYSLQPYQGRKSNGYPLVSDKFACPDFGGLPLSDYLSPGPILPYSASSGCYWRKCSFCPETAEGNPYRFVPPEIVLGHLEKLTSTIKPSLIHFLDNAISPALMRSLVDAPPGPAWYSFARVEKDLTDPDFCLALRHSGCVMLKLGLESGDQDVLDKMNKGIDLAMVSKALENLEQAGIATYVYLLFGTPAESPAAAQKSLEFAVRHSSAISFLNLAIFNMPISGAEATHLVNDKFYAGDLSLYADFVHPLGWDRRSVRMFIDRKFKRHPAIAPIIRRDPPFFTSNHAPFFQTRRTSPGSPILLK